MTHHEHQKDKATGKVKELEGKLTGDKAREGQGKAEHAGGETKEKAREVREEARERT